MSERPALYDYWRSSAAYRVRIALNLKGLEYDSRPVDILAGQHRQVDYLTLNPQGIVPTLQIDDLTLQQSLAIIEYLDETRPEPALLPADAAGRARVRAIAYAIAMEIHPVCNTRVANHVTELGGSETVRTVWMQHYIGRGLTAVEELLDHPATGRFCHGDAPSLADLCLVPQLYNAQRWELEVTQWPTIARIGEACAGLPAFDAAHPERHQP